MTVEQGVIVGLIRDRGFGFIRTGRGEDLFFHCSALEAIAFYRLLEGQAVEFVRTWDSSRARLHATQVRLLTTASGASPAEPDLGMAAQSSAPLQPSRTKPQRGG